MVERLDTDGRDELQFTTEILDADDDAKNYHAWAHRCVAVCMSSGVVFEMVLRCCTRC